MTALRVLGFSALATLVLIVAVQAQTRDLQRLHDVLHLSSQQEDGWRSFQMTMVVDPTETARQRNAAEMMPTLSAPRRVDLSIAAMEADLEALKHRGAALKV